jgi:opine dehydrogenase
MSYLDLLHALIACDIAARPVPFPVCKHEGPIVHPPRRDIRREGATAAVRAVTTPLEQERIRALHVPSADQYTSEGDEWMYGCNSHDNVSDSGDWREHIELSSQRYVLEDVGLGLAFLVSVGHWATVEGVVAEGLLVSSGTITGADLTGDGRTLETLDLAQGARAGTGRFLADGRPSP